MGILKKKAVRNIVEGMMTESSSSYKKNKKKFKDNYLDILENNYFSIKDFKKKHIVALIEEDNTYHVYFNNHSSYLLIDKDSDSEKFIEKYKESFMYFTDNSLNRDDMNNCFTTKKYDEEYKDDYEYFNLKCYIINNEEFKILLEETNN